MSKGFIWRIDGKEGPLTNDCGVCWTSSWSPCPEGTKDCVSDGRGGWMVCQMCRAEEFARKVVAERDEAVKALESISAEAKRVSDVTGSPAMLKILGLAKGVLDGQAPLQTAPKA